jgi:YfiH family protein
LGSFLQISAFQRPVYNQACMPNTSESAGDLYKVAANGVEWLAAPGMGGQNGDPSWLWNGFSTRRGGVSRAYLLEEDESGADSGEVNLGFIAADRPENVRENRLRFIKAVTGSRDTPLATVRQVHSNLSVVVGGDWPGPDSGVIPEVDGIMTNRRGVLIGIQTADCIPVLVADPVKRAVAAFHAGWRGTVQRIVELGVAQMVEEFGSDTSDLVAAIGPGIGQCCYSVGVEVLAQFESRFSYASELFLKDPVLRVDLVEANRRQLLAAGLRADSIARVGGCTSCQPRLFYSHRASGGCAGRMMAVIGIR